MAQNKKRVPTYRGDLLERLKDPEYAVGYLKAVLAEEDMPELFLVALKDVAEAWGISRLARDANLNRANLYKALSKKGNPELGSLYAILNALGLRLSVEMKEAS
ncbi:MAG TPA: putative addiction module antidote protein [Deltaproteobacteria bacterium]|nr:putative addiction module antidote protein [Deltaproteobacteria bacterium]